MGFPVVYKYRAVFVLPVAPYNMIIYEVVKIVAHAAESIRTEGHDCFRSKESLTLLQCPFEAMRINALHDPCDAVIA